MKYVLFIFATLLFLKESSGIYGGCMSYYTQPSDKPGHVKVEIYFLNGWKLHKGPCYNCTESDEGHDVTARRKMYIQDYGNPEAFGSYGFEPEVVTANVKPTNITPEVNNNVRDVVLMVNRHEQWEMESSKIALDVNLATTDSNKFDITFQSEPDVALTKVPDMKMMFLQVKVNSNIRKDTKTPNKSPVVLVKPYYSLELGKSYFLHIPIIDNDGDQFQCALSTYLEADGFGSFLTDLVKANALSIDKYTCILTLRVINRVFGIGDSFGIPVTVKDYVTEDTIVGTFNHFAYNTLMGRVIVLMYFNVTGDTHPPEFVTPTPPNNQKYTIYVGGDFHVNVYAKPTLNSRTITKFNFLRRDGKPVNQTRHEASLDQNVAYISMSWSPVDEDKGHHIVCANAEDSAGVSTVELHCFRIEVKANILRPNNKIQGKPYYASFPEPTDIVCPLHTYCRFPVYAATTNSGHTIGEIVSTSESEENVTIEYSHAVINGSLPTTVAQVEFLALLPGPRQICLNASDNVEWTTQCLYVTIQRPDPCASLPCQHGGLCSPSADNSEFQCHCLEPYTGQFCENGNKVCARNESPCFNTTCMDIPVPPHFMCGDCPYDKVGYKCDIDVDLCRPNVCNDRDICHQNRDIYECLPEKLKATCPAGCEKTSSTVCVQNECVCALGMQDDGFCKTKNHLFTNDQDRPYFAPPTPGIGSVITCDFEQTNCNFPIYVSSSSLPYVGSFNDTDTSSRNITFSTPLKDVSSDIYQITVSVESKTRKSAHEYIEYDVCLHVAKMISRVTITDKRCFHLVEKVVPQPSQTMDQIYPGCSFSSQTPQRESVIGCKKGKPCHFYIYAETNGSCPSLITHDEHTGIYTPELHTGLCRYDVVYTNTSACSSNTVCFMLCTKGESRCYKIQTNDITDQCSPNPCVNNAYCQTTIMGHLQCHCQQGNWGRYCENSFCSSSPYCQNDAFCFIDFNETNCLCRPGYIGSTCAQKIYQSITNGMEKAGHFTMMNHIDVLTCYINEPCSIPFSVFKYNNSKPNVELGHFDKTFELKSLVLEPSANQGGIVHGTLTVIGHDLGMKLICVDSFDSPQKTKIEDELCYKINVTKGQYFWPKKLFPYFLHPTPPDSTTMQCVVNEQCYINIWAKNKLGVDHCPLLQTDKNIEDGVHVFPLNDTVSQPCRFDVSILPDNTTALHLCFTLSSDASEVDNYQMYEDKRCFFISFLRELKGQSPCAGVSCQHNGFCDGSSSVSRCLCRSGFSSENCSKEFGLAQGIGNYSVSQLTPLFGDFVLPKFIRCPLREECMIPYSVTKTDSSCGFYLSWSGENFSSVHFTNSVILESLDCSGRATIIHNVSGIDEFCLSLKSSDGLISYDNVCCNVSSERDTADVNLYMFQSQFIHPSPTNGSEFSCTPGQPCHVMFSTGKHLNQKCPDVRDITTSPVHIFASLNTECHHDILILSEKNDTGSKKYCFQTMVSGITGETRCITVHFMFHVLPLNTTTTVTDISSTSTSFVSQSSLNVLSTTDVPITANSVNAQDSNTEGGSSTISLSTTSLSTNENSNNGQNVNTESSSTTISSSSTDMSTAAKTIIAQNSSTNSALTTASFSTSNIHVVSNSNNAQDSNTEGGSSTISISTTSLPTNANSNNGQNVNTESSSTTISSSSTNMSTAAKTIIAQNSSTNSALTTTSLSTTSLSTNANSNNGQNVNTESSSTAFSSSSDDMATVEKTIITQNPIAKSGSTTVPLSTTNMPVVSNSDNAQDSNTEVGLTFISLSTTSLSTNANSNNGQNVNTESSLSTISSSTIPLSTTNMPTVSMPDNAQDSNTEVGSTTILSSTSSIPSVSHSNIAQDSNTESVLTTIPFAPSAISPTVAQTSDLTTNHCNIKKVKQKVAKGRVECYCINPDNGIITKVIALNPRVSTEKLLIAAGLGSGAMVTTLGVAALLFTLTKGFRSSNKTGRTQNSRKSRKISVQSLKDEEN